MPSVLLVEDDDRTRKVLAMLFRSEGWSVSECVSGEEALPRLGEGFDALVTDHVLPGITGLELAREALSKDALRCAVVSGTPKPAEADALHLPWLPKPVDFDQLLRALG